MVPTVITITDLGHLQRTIHDLVVPACYLILDATWTGNSRSMNDLSRLRPSEDMEESTPTIHIQLDPDKDDKMVDYAIKVLKCPDVLPAIGIVDVKGCTYFHVEVDWKEGHFLRQKMKLKSLKHEDIPEAGVRIFVAGDRSQVGKSSVCLGLVGSLLKLGYSPERIAYIKPATQCEAPQLVTSYCQSKGIKACVPIGPIVYYKGFTREFLNGNTDSTEEMLDNVRRKVEDLAKGKDVVIIDGVGYPSVGSICGTSNADVAAACGEESRPVPVLLVGKSGVGDAVDSFNLNKTYFESKGVPVIGAVFNRLSSSGYYSLDNCKEAVCGYFCSQNTNQKPFGFIPEIKNLPNSLENPSDVDIAQLFIDNFFLHVDVKRILSSAKGKVHEKNLKRPSQLIQLEVKRKKHPKNVKLNREEIERVAKAQGAGGG